MISDPELEVAVQRIERALEPRRETIKVTLGEATIIRHALSVALRSGFPWDAEQEQIIAAFERRLA